MNWLVMGLRAIRNEKEQYTFPEFDDVMFLLKRERGRYWQKK